MVLVPLVLVLPVVVNLAHLISEYILLEPTGCHLPSPYNKKTNAILRHSKNLLIPEHYGFVLLVAFVSAEIYEQTWVAQVGSTVIRRIGPVNGNQKLFEGGLATALDLG